MFFLHILRDQNNRFTGHITTSMDREFYTSTGYKIFYGGAAMLLFAFSVYFISNSSDGKGGLLVPAVIFIIIGVAVCSNLMKRIFIITDNDLTYTSIWGSRELEAANVKGFRVGEKAIFIEPVQDGYPKIMVRDYGSLAANGDLIELLQTKFKDLNKAEFEEAKHQLLEDTSLGFTEADREATLKKFRIYTVVYGMGGLAFFFFTLYVRQVNPVLSLLAMIYPLAGIALMVFSKGLIWLFATKNDPHPSIYMGIFFPSLACVVKGLLDGHILSMDNLWVPAFVASAVMLTLLYYIAIKKTTATFLSQIFFALIISAGYGFGSVTLGNSVFDKSTPNVYPATITDRHVTHGKSTTYHIILSGWGTHEAGDNVSVSSSFYYYATVGSTVNVNLKTGFFKAPWFFLTQ
jgi:hypothetical protein